MFKLFKLEEKCDHSSDFPYLNENEVYFDSACQSLRPRQVVDAMREYYENFNSCGERVRYKWGKEVDRRVLDVRNDILKFLKLSSKNYCVSFTQNTTYGINLILSQLLQKGVSRVITSEIEHNSVMLPTLALANRLGVERLVLPRNRDGLLEINGVDFSGAVVVINATSNFDGRSLKNIKEIANLTKRSGGLLVIDAAQAMSFNHDLLSGVNADAICFSGHKMYGPSIGVIVFRYSLLSKLNITLIGGGMVGDVTKDKYNSLFDNKENANTAFELGLQPYAEIIGLGAAIRWLGDRKKSDYQELLEKCSRLFSALKSLDNIEVVNYRATPTISFYHKKIDSHLLAEALSDSGIMVRSGYFCAHYYLKNIKKYPPLIRVSLGLHTRSSDIEKMIHIMEKIG